MKRRSLLKLMAVGGGTLLVPNLLVACTSRQLAALEGWRGPTAGETDPRLLALSYGILAANPHNKQPWLIDLQGSEGFDLYVDAQRLLPETDPPYRQVHIGQGTFLENVALGVQRHGLRAEIGYFPRGDYGNAVLEPRPVARVRLVPSAGAVADALAAHLLTRRSNKRTYDGAPLPTADLQALRDGGDAQDMALTIETDATRLQRLARFAGEAMVIEVAGRARDLETLAMFRFDDEELERHRDGFGFAQAGLSGISKAFVQWFMSRATAEKPGSSWGEETVKLTAKQASSASAFGWLTTADNSRLTQVRVGRAYERLNLRATALGLAMHPMSQVLEEYADMAPLQQEFKAYLDVPETHTVQMFFRLGRAEPSEHAPRRRLGELLRA